ncbi:MAG: hypothetical protein Q8O14_01625 [bacterium]|jgi:hypothetical protein|nr:hypothetical protein [bacterium]
MTAPQVAITAMLLGPALLLKWDGPLWLALLLLLMVNALALVALGRPRPPASRGGLLVLVGLLLVLPLQSSLLALAARVTGVAEQLPVIELTFVLFCHLTAFQFLMARMEAAQYRRRGVQAAFWLPVALALLALLVGIEHVAMRMALAVGTDPALPASGWLRLVLAALGVALMQGRRSPAPDPRNPRSGGRP